MSFAPENDDGSISRARLVLWLCVGLTTVLFAVLLVVLGNAK